MKRIKFYLPVLALITLMFVSCEKETTEHLSIDAIDVAAANSLSEQTIVDMQTMSEESVVSSLKSATTSDSSIIPTRERFKFNEDSTTTIIDFGAGVGCRDGKIRKGQIIITRELSPSQDHAGNVITFTTIGYEVDSVKIEIIKKLTCLGWIVDNEYPNGYLKYNVTVENGLITRPNGDIITINVTHTRKLVSYNGGARFAGWIISGTSSHSIERLTSGRIIGATTLIMRDLQRPLRHHHFIAGEFESIFLSGKSVTVDYGTGNIFDPTTWGKREIIRSGDAMESRNQN